MANKIDSCLTCKHLEIEKNNGIKMPSGRCKAFPEGIPIEIQFGSISHDKPFPGDNGIRYEKKIIKSVIPPVIRRP
tara:strand:- start:2077 stop:2304 length:228 start_codon:yes stop_codon:yes gene_type:complete